MKNILIVGAGKIGSLITLLLAKDKLYNVTLIDLDFQSSDFKRIQTKIKKLKTQTLDFSDDKLVKKFFNTNKFDAVISCLPFHSNVHVAHACKEFKINYFDLTEDVNVKNQIKNIAKDSSVAFVPHCGIAPGIIGIIAAHLMQHFEILEEVKLRVGAIPQRVNNALHYALTWSTEGVINQYINPCHIIKNHRKEIVPALTDCELIEIDGVRYEAFNTSGGVGSLTELCENKVNNLNYKTIRYVGHCEKIRFLLNDLKLSADRKTLKYILENALPKTYQDLVLVYVSVTGRRHGDHLEESYVTKILPVTIDGLSWSAIQVATAYGACAIMDTILNAKKKYSGFVELENLSFDEILKNKFGKIFDN